MTRALEYINDALRARNALMEPVSIIVSAVVAGASAALKDTTGQVVKDAYAGLKRFILDRYGGGSVELVEQDPGSQGRELVLK